MLASAGRAVGLLLPLLRLRRQQGPLCLPLPCLRRLLAPKQLRGCQRLACRLHTAHQWCRLHAAAATTKHSCRHLIRPQERAPSLLLLQPRLLCLLVCILLCRLALLIWPLLLRLLPSHLLLCLLRPLVFCHLLLRRLLSCCRLRRLLPPLPLVSLVGQGRQPCLLRLNVGVAAGAGQGRRGWVAATRRGLSQP